MSRDSQINGISISKGAGWRGVPTEQDIARFVAAYQIHLEGTLTLSLPLSLSLSCLKAANNAERQQ